MELSSEPEGPIAEGQLVCCHLALCNTGAMPLQDLRVAALSEDVLVAAPHRAADADPVAYLAGMPCPLLAGCSVPGAVNAD